MFKLLSFEIEERKFDEFYRIFQRSPGAESKIIIEDFLREYNKLDKSQIKADKASRKKKDEVRKRTMRRFMQLTDIELRIAEGIIQANI